MTKLITSLQNPLIKQVVQLQSKSRERKKSGLFIIEGKREVALSLKGGYTLKTILICPEIFSETLANKINPEVQIVEISLEIYQKLAYRTSTEGIIAIAQTKALLLTDLTFKNKSPLLLIAEAPEKPGNTGALLRTADAANLDAVIIANPKTDLYNPNIIRSSVGCLFTNQIAIGSTIEVLQFLQQENIKHYSATLQNSVAYHDCDFKGPTAIVVGTEADGLSKEWRERSEKNIIIPMHGEIDSMNVSVAAGILIFEAKRQRNFQ